MAARAEPPRTETTFEASGPAGGPFVGSGPVTLIQDAPKTFRYAITCDASWLDWDVPTKGTVPAGGDLVATLSVDEATAPTAVGTYTGTLTLKNSRSKAVRALCNVTLEVTALSVPNFEFQASGPPGGPFSGAPASFEFENGSTEAYSYELTSDQTWVDWSVPATGTVSGSGSLLMGLTIDAAAAPTAAGTHAAVVTLTDTTSQTTRGTIDVSLSVEAEAEDDGSGWTDPVPSADSRLVHVSSSAGNDANNGLSASAAVRTIGRAKTIVRDGYPDWLLLKRGDTFTTGFGSWERSGRSASEPCVIWSYGTGARPVVAPTSGSAWSVMNDPRHHVYVMGIDFVGNRDGSTGLWIAAADGTSDLLFEDLRIRGWTMGMSPQGVNDLRIRRCAIYENGNPNGHGQGIFFNLCDGVLVEECVIDMNGWVAGSFAATIFDHNLYFSDANENCVLRGNIIARASSHGAHFRSGGTVEGNLFLHNPLNLQFGYAQGSTNGKPDGVTGEVRGNVILGGGDIDGQERGVAILLHNVASATVGDNVCAHGTGGSPTSLGMNSQFGIGVHDVAIEDNVWYRWGGSTWIDDDNVSGITLTGNDFQEPSGGSLWMHLDSALSGSSFTSSGNRFHTTTSDPYRIPSPSSFSTWRSWIGDSTSTQTQAVYPDPELTIADYDDSIGGTGSLASFLTEARKQCRDNWRSDYTAAAAVEYFREAFGR